MDHYSRLVAIFKVLLPLLALAILATLFLLSRGTDFAAIPFAEEDVAERLKSQQITEPFFSGVTPAGEEITVKAALARPGAGDAPAEALDLSASITLADGAQIDMQSQTGRINIQQDLAQFEGDVRITASTGYTVTTDRLETALSGVSASTPGQVSGTGPIGDFTAGRMTIGAKNEGEPIHMLFNGGVKLIYDPKHSEE